MKKAENKRELGRSQRDKVEPKGYENAQSHELGKHLETFSPSQLMWRVVARENLKQAIKVVKRNKGAAGIDGMTVNEIEAHIWHYYPQLVNKLMNATYKPQAVKRVEIPKPNGKVRKLGIPVVRDRVIQQAIKQVIEPFIDKQFHPHSHGFRKGKSTHTALKQCIAYYEEGSQFVVDCDLTHCFDTLNHDKLMYYLEQYIQDKAVLHFIRQSLIAGVIDLSGAFIESPTGAPQGGVLSPLLSNVYLHQLDMELTKRGHKFVRYADDLVIYVKSRRAGERVMSSITQFIERDLKLMVNQDKSKVGSPTRLKFLSCLISPMSGGCRFRPTKEAKQRLKNKLRKVTRRNRAGTFSDIINEINAICRGWINYFGQGHIKGFIKVTQHWFHHRMRQWILKRWKHPRTIIRKLQSYGLDVDSAKRIAFSRKKYWRLSNTPEIHRAITTKRLRQWELISLTDQAESVYLNY